MAGLREIQFQNQLQFNLNVPLTTSSISTHFHRPKPIVVERIADKADPSVGFPITHLMHRGHGDSSYPPLKSTGDASQFNSFQFSALSADRLAAAVELAKRDVKKRKMQQADFKQASESTGKIKTAGLSHKERTIYGQKYWERLKQTKTTRGQKSKDRSNTGKMKPKEHDRNREPYDSSTQTPTGSPPRQQFLSNKLVSSHQERADSPPTRDTPSGTRLARVPKDEIEKLQQEMEMYLQQIESVERRALSEHSTDFLQRDHRSGFQGKDNELLEEEDRRQLRAGEQTARATRTIYNLRQQVKQIERDILLGPSSIKGTVKSKSAARLAAAHRGAVRALQMFVNQLPHQDLRGGLPSHYHELSLLIRQLTMLSAQIPFAISKSSKESAEGKTGGGYAKTSKDGREKEKKGPARTSEIQNDLVAMLDRVEKLNVDWCQEIKSKDALTPQKKQKPPFVTNFNDVKKPLAVEKLAKFQGQSDHRDEWDRKALLQASVRALVRGLKKSFGKQQQKSQLKARQAAWDVPVKKVPPRKGLMLGKLKTRRQQAALKKHQQREDQEEVKQSVHFAEPTITASLKASTPLQNPFTHHLTRSLSEPASPWARNKDLRFDLPSGEHIHSSYPGAQREGGGTYGSHSSHSCHSRSHSPRLQQNRSRSPSPVSRKRSQSPQAQRQRFFVQDVDSELVNELFPREKISRQSRKDKSQQQGRSDENDLLRRADVSESFISEVERRVMNRLKLLLDEAKNSGRANDGEEREKLAEMILDDVLEETVHEVQAMEQSNTVHRRVASLLDNPTLENIHQRLEEMEKEHLEIRQRWSSVTYHDTVPTRRWRPSSKSMTKSEQPRDPPAFEVTRLPLEMASEPCRTYPVGLLEEPLVFTKDSKAVQPCVTFEAIDIEHADRQFLVPQRSPAALASKCASRPRKLLSMKQTVVEKICDHAERFDYFQRGLRHHLGKKEGWRVIESLADQILDDCYDEVAAELEHISTAMAEHIYTSEFMDQNGLPLAPTDLASDFIVGGSAAQNLRDSEAARQQVEDTFARMDLGSPHLQHHDDTSPVNPTSLRNVFDATDLYEASGVGEVLQADNRLTRTSKSKDDDTQLLDVDYDDDFSDISDYDDTDDEGSSA